MTAVKEREWVSMRRKITKKIVFLGAAAAVIAAAAIAVAISARQKLETARVMVEDVEDYYTEEGVIRSGGEYEITAQVSGPVKAVYVKENDTVKQGDVILEIDTTDYEYQKSLQESNLAVCEAQLELSRINQVMTASPGEYLETMAQQLAAAKADYQAAKSVYDADQILLASGSISRIQMEAAASDYEKALSLWQQAEGRYEESRRFLDSLKETGIDETTINDRFYASENSRLEAQVKACQTAVEQFETQIDRCQIKAQKDGVIVSLPAETRTYIQMGETAAVISASEQFQAEADLLTNVAPYVKEGEAVKAVVKLRGADEIYSGTVSRVYSYAAKGISALGLDEYRVHVEVDLDQAENLEHRDGYGVELTFLLYQGKECLTIPESAVFETDDGTYVFRAEGGRAVKTPVEVEYRTGTKAVISSGLEAGDTVVDQVDTEGIYEGISVK